MNPKLVIMEHEYRDGIEWAFRAYDQYDDLQIETFHVSQGDALIQVARSMISGEVYDVTQEAVLVG